jgi:hypothetical protein
MRDVQLNAFNKDESDNAISLNVISLNPFWGKNLVL